MHNVQTEDLRKVSIGRSHDHVAFVLTCYIAAEIPYPFYVGIYGSFNHMTTLVHNLMIYFTGVEIPGVDKDRCDDLNNNNVSTFSGGSTLDHGMCVWGGSFF